MKNAIIITIIAVFVITTAAFIKPPKKATVTFGVSGVCGMCKERIEAAMDKPGITKAVWDLSTKKLTVTYNPRKYEEIQLHNIVATAGHDTEKVKANEQVYADLPECCQYRTVQDHP
jgi:Heavy-metal-associated domain